MPDLDGRQRGLRPGAVSWPRGPRRGRRGRGRRGGRERLAAALLQRAQLGERQLLRVREAAEPRELRGQLQILGDEALVLAIEEQADLAQRVDVALLRQIHHAESIGSSGAVGGKRKVRQRRRRQRDASHEGAAVQKQIELTDGQRDRRVALIAPEGRESTTLEALRIDAEPGAIPLQHLRAHAIATDEDIHIAVQWIPLQPRRDERAQPIEAFAHVDRLRIGVDGHAAPGPSHRSSVSKRAALSTVRPSTRGPAAVI